MTGQSGSTQTVFVLLYLALLVVFFAASFFTELRLWGISTWGYLPLWGRLLFLGFGLALIPVAMKLGQEESSVSSPRRSTVILSVLSAALVAGLCFWFFRGQTHFLGDGYVNIGLLSGRMPFVVNRDFGEMQLHLWLASLLGGNTKENVLLSYQLLSVAAGILFLLLISWTALRLFQRTRDAVLFGFAVVLSGQVLLFFGYVENYSLFVLAVGCFTCVGLLAALGKVARWTILIPLAFAIMCHIFGVIFVLPAAYLLLAGGRMEKRIVDASWPVKLVMVLASVIIVAAALWLAMDYSLFLRISLLSFTDTRFTVEGYTLFSVAHLGDYGNLLLLLIPGLPLLLVMLWKSPVKNLSAGTDVRFLSILAVTALTPAFIFDPKLAMPRDWDLFSFAAIPLSALLAYALLDRRSSPVLSRTVLILAVVLAGLSATARVTTQFVPSMALRQVEDYVDLDKVKGKQAANLVQIYYGEVRNREEFDRWGQRYLSYPEEQLIARADSLMARNRLSEALINLTRARQYNPMNSLPYSRMSVIYLRLGRVGEARALLDTALGLRPGNPDALVGKGYFLQQEGNLAEAERSYIRATEIAPERSLAWFYLARLRLTHGDTTQYVKYLETAATKSDAAPELHIELCNVYISKGRYREAAEVLRQGMEKGLSRQVVGDVLKSHPELRMYLSP